MRTTQQKKPTTPKQRQRKPPRLTPSIFKYANRFGFNVRISQKPDGSIETELTKGDEGKGDTVNEWDSVK